MFSGIYSRLGLLMAGGILYSASLFAQKQMSWTDFWYVRNSNPWLTSDNAAGFNSLDIPKTSFAETFFIKGNGRFVNFYQSDNSFRFGGTTESFLRLNNKVVFYGKMDYSGFQGKNMGGSMFFDPYYNPFDIVEFADSTAGKKKMETYQLSGAISSALFRNIFVGVKADYKTISYFKMKDLRHANDIMDLKVTAGLQYKWRKIAYIGLNYFYRRSTEGITLESKGNVDQQFNSLISFGAFFGRQERFGETGYTTSGDNNPFFNQFHGGSFQVDLFPERNTHFYNEFGLKFRKGYFGKNSSASIVFTEHEGSSFEYSGMVARKNALSLHQLQLGFTMEFLDNYENAYRKETSSGGNTTTVYYGKNKVLNRSQNQFSLAYTGNLNVNDNNPEWTIHLGAAVNLKNQTAVVYPAFRKQDMGRITIETSAKRNIVRGKNMLGFSLGMEYASGFGTEKQDGKYGAQGSQTSFASLDRYLYREFEFLTAQSVGGSAGFRFTRQILQNKIRAYADLNYNITKAFSVVYIGDSFNGYTFKIGCLF